ncbi:hypothetical protein CTKZ_10690 [Cellulomonas algicola]|uniref:Uncharacterized protein n=1 Tax=Cellulomonas algicola TaxID=2071633 RepID=A0A401UXT9_9CELL|nr:hypothetical protein [Cellulomonas algicola]GCD19507.1 hypothetical protein CTKZ_10690 [Cellulomonas algicola]
MDDAVRTVRWDGGWATLVGRRLEGEPTADAWHAIARGRRTALRLGRPHLIDLPDETVVERVSELDDRADQAPWVAPPTDPRATLRSRSAVERATRARERLAEPQGGREPSRPDVGDAAGSAREVQRAAAAVRARSADVFERAALAHEAAADVHERLARLGSDAGRHRSRAREHREAAEVDWRMSRAGRPRGARAASQRPGSTDEELRSTVEELETANEDLLSTHEELDTVGEELQSIELAPIAGDAEQRPWTVRVSEVDDLTEEVLSPRRGRDERRDPS